MFGLDSLSRSVAVAEMLFLLALAALIGWLLGRWVRNGRVHALRSALADKQTQVEALRQTTAGSVSGTVATSPGGADAKPLRPVATGAPRPPVVEPLSTSTTESVGRPESRTSAGAVDGSGVDTSLVGVPIPPVPAFDAPRPDQPRPVEPAPVPANARSVNRPLPNSLLPGNTEAAVLNRIALRADELNFDRIGRATAAEADDLKDIVGIGPFLERKLHSLGIYTYRQIANFTKEDSEQVNDIIEFFPGRVERDNWVGQAQQFHERKHGART